MEIRVKFVGGRFNGRVALVDGLDHTRAFVHQEFLKIDFYVREDEVVYVFEPLKSLKLSEQFAEAKQKFSEMTLPSSLRWVEEESLEEDTP